VMTQPEVLQIATAHGVGPAQIGLKWIVQQGLPLTTAVWDLKYMRQDLDLWSWVCTSFFEFSLCLSRACLGKTIHFIYKWRKSGQACAPADSFCEFHESAEILKITPRQAQDCPAIGTSARRFESFLHVFTRVLRFLR
jgi:hypothetical protein